MRENKVKIDCAYRLRLLVSDRKLRLVFRGGWEWGTLGLIQWKRYWWDAKVKREVGVGVHGELDSQ